MKRVITIFSPALTGNGIATDQGGLLAESFLRYKRCQWRVVVPGLPCHEGVSLGHQGSVLEPSVNPADFLNPLHSLYGQAICQVQAQKQTECKHVVQFFIKLGKEIEVLNSQAIIKVRDRQG